MEYAITIDATLSKTVYREANSAEEARAIVLEEMDKDPFYHTKGFDSLLCCEIVDVDEVI